MNEFITLFVSSKKSHKIIAAFKYSSEARVTKSKLDSEGFKTMLIDEKTIGSDSLISSAIGSVKLQVHKNDFEKVLVIYDEISAYLKDKSENNFSCPIANLTEF